MARSLRAVIVLVIGGTRSGKSAVAEGVAATLAGPVTYVATAPTPGEDDPALAARITAHRDRRPAGWRTVEAGAELVDVLADLADGTVLVDSLGSWLGARSHDERPPPIAELVEAMRRRRGDTVVVTEEVGLAVHPLTDVGRRFVDDLGRVNQAVAEVADDVWLVVAGRVLRLDRFEP